MLLKSTIVGSNLDFFVDLVSFNASTIFKPNDDERGWKNGHWDGVPWRINFMYRGLYGVLSTSTKTLEVVGVAFFKRKTMCQND